MKQRWDIAIQRKEIYKNLTFIQAISGRAIKGYKMFPNVTESSIN